MQNKWGGLEPLYSKLKVKKKVSTPSLNPLKTNYCRKLDKMYVGKVLISNFGNFVLKYELLFQIVELVIIPQFWIKYSRHKLDVRLWSCLVYLFNKSDVTLSILLGHIFPSSPSIGWIEQRLQSLSQYISVFCRDKSCSDFQWTSLCSLLLL